MRVLPRSAGVRQMTPHQCHYCFERFFSPRKTTGRPQLYCSKRCRKKASRQGFVPTGYIASQVGQNAENNTAVSAACKSEIADRPWRQVAGPPLSASALHCATLSGAEVVAAANRANLKFWQEAQ